VGQPKAEPAGGLVNAGPSSLSGGRAESSLPDLRLSNLIIRPARLADAASLQCHCYPEHSVDDLRAYLTWCLRPSRRHRLLRLVAASSEHVMGTAELTRWPGWGEVGSLVVAPAFRRRGVARRLLEALAVRARQWSLPQLALRVHRENEAAQRLYRQAGFVPLAPGLRTKPKLFPPDDTEHLVFHQVLESPEGKSFWRGRVR
jgi:ribosomal protein S18 acetylase RimI-like enzyme